MKKKNNLPGLINAAIFGNSSGLKTGNWNIIESFGSNSNCVCSNSSK